MPPFSQHRRARFRFECEAQCYGGPAPFRRYLCEAPEASWNAVGQHDPTTCAKMALDQFGSSRPLISPAAADPAGRWT